MSETNFSFKNQQVAKLSKALASVNCWTRVRVVEGFRIIRVPSGEIVDFVVEPEQLRWLQQDSVTCTQEKFLVIECGESNFAVPLDLILPFGSGSLDRLIRNRALNKLTDEEKKVLGF